MIYKLRGGKRVREILHTKEGKRLHVVEYRVPEPGYRGSGCTPPTPSVDPDDLLEGLWAAAIESPIFCGVLDRLSPGLCEQVREEHLLGVGINATAGAALGAFLMSVQCSGLTPLLLRASEIRDPQAAERFVRAWSDLAQRTALKDLAKRVYGKHRKDEQHALARDLRAVGLTLANYQDKGGRTPEEAQSTARAQLRRIIAGSSGRG